MPELPDVESFRTYLNSTALKQRIARSSVKDKRILRETTPAKLSARLKGSAIESTDRHGKFLFCELTRNGWLVLHFGMTGELSYYKDAGKEPEWAVLTMDFENGYHLAYVNKRVLGQVRVVDDKPAFIESQKLGIDAASDDLTLPRFRELVAGRSGMVKTTLMNQSVIAGIGNVYADEILFQAGVHPEARVDKLGDEGVKAVHRALKRVLKASLDRNGDISRLPRSYLLPRRDQDEIDCPRCGGRIATITVGGRTTYLCPECQNKP